MATIKGLKSDGTLPPVALAQVQQVAANAVTAALSADTERVESIVAPAVAEAMAKYQATGETVYTDPTPLPSTPARRAIVLGDSGSDPRSAGGAGGVWWWQSVADLAGLTIVGNVATAGDTVASCEAQAAAAEKADANLALVMFGTDDRAADPEEHATALRALVDRIKAAGKRVLVVFPAPLFAAANDASGTTFRTLRERARNVAAAAGVYYVDAWADLATGPGQSTPSTYDAGDGVHLNDAGHWKMGAALAARVKQVAAVTDPYDGVRNGAWFEDWHVQGATENVRVETAPNDALFRGEQSAVLAGGTDDVVIWDHVSATPGERWEVSYAYRVEQGTAAEGPYRGSWTEWTAWPSGASTRETSREAITDQQGVRRYQVTVPADATADFVVSRRVGTVEGNNGYRIRVGRLGLRRIS